MWMLMYCFDWEMICVYFIGKIEELVCRGCYYCCWVYKNWDNFLDEVDNIVFFIEIKKLLLDKMI